MQTAPNTDLIEFENWTLRVRKTDHPSPKLLLMIHGFTGDENSMWVFARDLPAHYWIIAPRAPHIAERGGYSWRPLQGDDFGRPSLEQLRPAAEALIRLVDAYQLSAEIDANVFDVMGFSQGGAMSNLLAFLYPQRIRKTGILAGFIPSGLEGTLWQSVRWRASRSSLHMAHAMRPCQLTVPALRSIFSKKPVRW